MKRKYWVRKCFDHTSFWICRSIGKGNCSLPMHEQRNEFITQHENHKLFAFLSVNDGTRRLIRTWISLRKEQAIGRVILYLVLPLLWPQSRIASRVFLLQLVLPYAVSLQWRQVQSICSEATCQRNRCIRFDSQMKHLIKLDVPQITASKYFLLF